MCRTGCVRWLACALMALTFSAAATQVDISTPIPNDTPTLSAADVTQVLLQAVGFLKSIKESGIISVADREGHILAIFRMTPLGSLDIRINEQATTKARTASFFESEGDAITTRTAQFIVQANFPPGIRNVDAGPLFGVPFSNFPGGDVQLQVPPAIVFVNALNAPRIPALLPPPFLDPGLPVGNNDVRPSLQPLVITPLTDDPGGLPLFKGKRAVGSVGVEIDGFGVLGDGIPDKGVGRVDTGIVPGPSKALIEEQAALTAQNGFRPPAGILATRILVNGFRLPYVTARTPRTQPVATLVGEGNFEPYFDTNGSERSPTGTPISANPYAMTFDPKAVTSSAVRGTPTQEFPRQGFVARFPARDSPLGQITKADVLQMVQQAANQAARTRGAIRNPKGVSAQVWISVVDTAGNICGVFRTNDATVFSFDLAVQKARTSAFFSTNTVGFSSRAIGFMSQTFYPPGVSAHAPGPISGLINGVAKDAGSLGSFPIGNEADHLTEISQVLTDTGTNTIVSSLPPGTNAMQAAQLAVQLLGRRIPHIRDGRISPLQAAITVDLTLRAAYGAPPPPTLRDGYTNFPGGVPIYKNGLLVGGLGVSGDGVDQDDIIVFNGHLGFEPPQGVRCDQADEASVKAALLVSIPKLKAEFPTLTNGSTTSPAVIDVIEQRLNTGPILEGLRLPYVKFPRQPGTSN